MIRAGMMMEINSVEDDWFRKATHPLTAVKQRFVAKIT